MILALILWLYSFYRLWLVWQNTLNFSESSIQGPQGWDLLVTWVVERIRIKKLRVLNLSTRRKAAVGGVLPVRADESSAGSAQNPSGAFELVERTSLSDCDKNIDLGSAMNKDFESSPPQHGRPDSVSIDMTAAIESAVGSADLHVAHTPTCEVIQVMESKSDQHLNKVTQQQQLKQYLSSMAPSPEDPEEPGKFLPHPRALTGLPPIPTRSK